MKQRDTHKVQNHCGGCGIKGGLEQYEDWVQFIFRFWLNIQMVIFSKQVKM